MIPKKIHYCWLSDDEYPPLISYCINSWKNKMPEYELVLWDKNKIHIEKIPWVKQAYDNKKYAFAADFIRLYAVYTEGGIYLDSDVEVLKKFDNLLNQKSFIGLETGGDFEPAIIGAEPNMDWIGKCLEYYKNKEFINCNGVFETKPLPLIVGEILKKEYNIEPKVAFWENIGLKVYSSEYFSPKSIHTNQIFKTKDTFAIHHYDGAWVRKDIKYKIKNILHIILIRLIGQKKHNDLIKKIRK